MNHPAVHGLAVTLIDAARMPLDQAPLLEQLVLKKSGSPSMKTALCTPSTTASGWLNGTMQGCTRASTPRGVRSAEAMSLIA